jgi:hypothetical protein
MEQLRDLSRRRLDHMDAQTLVQSEQHPLGQHKHRKEFFDRYEWQFVLLGLLGNLLFFVGSVLFLREATQTHGVWLFITGSCLMLVSSSAASLAEYSRSKLKSKQCR